MKRNDCNSSTSWFCACNFKIQSHVASLLQLSLRPKTLPSSVPRSFGHSSRCKIDFDNSISIEMFPRRCEAGKSYPCYLVPWGELKNSQKPGGLGWKESASVGSDEIFSHRNQSFHSFVGRRDALSMCLTCTFALFAEGHIDPWKWRTAALIHRPRKPSKTCWWMFQSIRSLKASTMEAPRRTSSVNVSCRHLLVRLINSNEHQMNETRRNSNEIELLTTTATIPFSGELSDVTKECLIYWRASERLRRSVEVFAPL